MPLTPRIGRDRDIALEQLELDHSMTGLGQWGDSERVGRFREAVLIIDRLLRGETVSYEGKYSRVEAATLAL